MPDVPPPVFVSGFGEKAIKLAGRIADGYMCVQPNADFVRLYRESGGGKRTVQGGLKVFWGPDEAGARKTMHRLWSNEAIPGEAAQLLPLPRHFAQLSEPVSEDMINAPVGPRRMCAWPACALTSTRGSTTMIREFLDDDARARLVSNISGHLLNGVSEPVLQRVRVLVNVDAPSASGSSRPFALSRPTRPGHRTEPDRPVSRPRRSKSR